MQGCQFTIGLRWGTGHAAWLFLNSSMTYAGRYLVTLPANSLSVLGVRDVTLSRASSLCRYSALCSAWLQPARVTDHDVLMAVPGGVQRPKQALAESLCTACAACPAQHPGHSAAAPLAAAVAECRVALLSDHLLPGHRAELSKSNWAVSCCTGQAGTACCILVDVLYVVAGLQARSQECKTLMPRTGVCFSSCQSW